MEEGEVQVDGPAGETIPVRMINTQGQVMSTWSHTVTGSPDTSTPDLRDYTRDIYIVNVQVGERYECVRVVE